MINLFSINTYKDAPKKKQKPMIVGKVSNRGLVYNSIANTASRTSFQESEYNLGEVSKVVDVEAYVRQAFGKHTELCMKEGYEISSRNEDATVYVKKRLREMADISGVTFDQILRSITQNVISYSNAFIVKVRDMRKSSGKSILRSNGKPVDPVAAYFPVDPTSVHIKRTMHGKVLKYEQKIPGNPYAPKFNAEDIVHVFYDRKEGFAYGTPYIIPVLDDIRSLRRMEENIEMLLVQHLFPLYQYIVGTEDNPAEVYDDGTTEVDVIRDQVEQMPTEGSIVTPERHDIKNIGAQGKALDASKYLAYFEARVLAGLGMSEIALGRGGSANRATAGTIDKMMTDRCKDFQDVIEGFVNEQIFKELLYEGGFAIDEAEDNFVKLKFNEIDIDSMLKVENHSIFKYEHDAITETEMRELLGHDPIADEQREDMYLDRVTIPKVEAEADGAIKIAKESPQPVAAKTSTSSSSSNKKKATNNKNKPTNQHGTKPAKTTQKTDAEKQLNSLLDHLWHLTKLDIIDMAEDLDDWSNIDIERFRPIAVLTCKDLEKQTASFNIDSKKLDKEVKEIFNDVANLLCSTFNSIDRKGDIPHRISGVFETFRYRLSDLSESLFKED